MHETPLPTDGDSPRRLEEASPKFYEAPRVTFRQALDRVAADCTGIPGGKNNPIDCSIGSS